MDGDMAAQLKYACTVQKGRGKLEYKFVDTETMEIISKLVGGEKNPGPVAHGKGMFVTYEDLSELNRYQMWVGQEWADTPDSQSIKAARASINKRSDKLKTYEDCDTVAVQSSGKIPTIVEVPFDNVITFLAQRLSYSVVSKDDESGLVLSEEEEDEPASVNDGSSSEQDEPLAKTPVKPLAKTPVKPLAKLPVKPLAKQVAKLPVKPLAKQVAKLPVKPLAKQVAKPKAKPKQSAVSSSSTKVLDDDHSVVPKDDKDENESGLVLSEEEEEEEEEDEHASVNDGSSSEQDVPVKQVAKPKQSGEEEPTKPLVVSRMILAHKTKHATVDEVTPSTAQEDETAKSPPSTPGMDDGSKAKRKADGLLAGTPKRSRQQHKVSDGMLSETVKMLVNNDLAQHKEFNDSLDSILRIAKKLAADLEAASLLAKTLVADMIRRREN
jgi:hypothetical protein